MEINYILKSGEDVNKGVVVVCMSSYLNPGNKGFQESLNLEIYIDKTG